MATNRKIQQALREINKLSRLHPGKDPEGRLRTIEALASGKLDPIEHRKASYNNPNLAERLAAGMASRSPVKDDAKPKLEREETGGFDRKKRGGRNRKDTEV